MQVDFAGTYGGGHNKAPSIASLQAAAEAERQAQLAKQQMTGTNAKKPGDIITAKRNHDRGESMFLHGKNSSTQKAATKKWKALPGESSIPPSPTVVGSEVQRIEILEWRTKADEKGKKFVSYVVTVHTRTGYHWTIEKRYNEFQSFHKRMNELRTLARQGNGRGYREAAQAAAYRAEDNIYEKLEETTFPPGSFFGKFSQETLEKRRQAFETYLGKLLEFNPRPPDLNRFLETPQNLMAKGIGLLSPRSIKPNKWNGVKEELPEPPAKTMDDFKLLKVIGKGAFGKVYLVREKDSSHLFALKVLKKVDIRRKNQDEHTKMERAVMGAITHPFIVTLRYAFQNADRLFMVTDYCQGGELFFHLQKRKRFTQSVAAFYAGELVQAIEVRFLLTPSRSLASSKMLQRVANPPFPPVPPV
jgi:hypothetical protein